ncbi:MAG: hypothetical protein R3A78_10815 [Polyangiales bacterium]|nr:hypothetical protein [Myxococcales bacterium]
MAKKRREKRDKQAEREAKRADEEAQLAEQGRRATTRRNVLLGIPTLTVAAGAGAWWGLESRGLTVGILVGGLLVWLALGLAFLGAGIQPRDRLRGSNIDYGRRNRR